MTSITSWVRLEPQGRDADLKPGVEARLHDPLWLLTRQWQLGELDGEAGGSAIGRPRAVRGRPTPTPTATCLPPDPPLLTESERRFVDAVRERAPDGAGIAAALRVSLPALPPALAIVDTDGKVAVWLRWYDAHEVEPPHYGGGWHLTKR